MAGCLHRILPRANPHLYRKCLLIGVFFCVIVKLAYSLPSLILSPLHKMFLAVGGSTRMRSSS